MTMRSHVSLSLRPAQMPEFRNELADFLASGDRPRLRDRLGRTMNRPCEAPLAGQWGCASPAVWLVKSPKQKRGACGRHLNRVCVAVLLDDPSSPSELTLIPIGVSVPWQHGVTIG